MATATSSPRGRLLSAIDAAAYLGIGVHHVRRIIARGEITVLRTPGGRLMGIYERDCDAWVEARQRASTVSATQAKRDVDREVAALIGEERVF